MRKSRVTIEIPTHLKRAFMSILARKGQTQTGVLLKHIENIVEKDSKRFAKKGEGQ